MGDLLGAYSLICAAITALYSLWYPEIKAFLRDHDWPPVVDAMNIQGQYAELKEIRQTKIFPLLLAGIGIAVIFLPTVISILVSCFRELSQNGLHGSVYDPVSVCLIFLLVLNGFLVKKIWELNSEVQGYLQENQ
jgi:hypothetical protein